MEQAPRHGFYAIIPADVRYDSRLKPNEKLLYAEITSLSSQHGYCWAKNEWLSQLFTCGGKLVNPKTISSWISNLEKCGHITTQIVTKNGMVVGRRIYIKAALPSVPETAEIGDAPYPQKNGDVSMKNGNTSPQKDGDVSIKKWNTPPQKDGIELIHTVSNTPIRGDVLFDRFWAAWPRKDGKKQALSAWKKLKATPELLDVILKAIEQQSAALRWTPDRRQYIPFPATWLNGERWNDEVSNSAPQYPTVPAQFGQNPPPDDRRRFRIT